jgi:hypothetical protein
VDPAPGAAAQPLPTPARSLSRTHARRSLCATLDHAHARHPRSHHTHPPHTRAATLPGAERDGGAVRVHRDAMAVLERLGASRAPCHVVSAGSAACARADAAGCVSCCAAGDGAHAALHPAHVRPRAGRLRVREGGAVSRGCAARCMEPGERHARGGARAVERHARRRGRGHGLVPGVLPARQGRADGDSRECVRTAVRLQVRQRTRANKHARQTAWAGAC